MGHPLKFCTGGECLALPTLVLAHSREEAWEAGRAECAGAALSAQNFAFHPEGSGETLRMVKQGGDAIERVLENLLAAVGCRGARRQRD